MRDYANRIIIIINNAWLDVILSKGIYLKRLRNKNNLKWGKITTDQYNNQQGNEIVFHRHRTSG